MTAVTVPTVISAYDVEQAVVSQLRIRMPYYAEQLSIASPKSYQRLFEFTKFPEDQVPAILVVCPGLADLPQKFGDGNFRATWEVGVGAIVTAKTMDDSDRICKQYGALMRAVILQQPSLQGFAVGVTWIDENYDQLDVDTRRTVATAELTFYVDVDGVVNSRELPLMPGGPLPTPGAVEVTETGVDVIPVSIDEEVTP